MNRRYFKEFCFLVFFGLPLASVITACESNLGSDIAGAEAANQQGGSTNSVNQQDFYVHCTGSGQNSAVDAVGTTGFASVSSDGQATTGNGTAEFNPNANPCQSAWLGSQVVPQIVNSAVQSFKIDAANGTSLQVALAGLAGGGSAIPTTGVINGSTYLSCAMYSAYGSRSSCPANSVTLVSCPALNWFVCSN
jgi:hypothetical protein